MHLVKLEQDSAYQNSRKGKTMYCTILCIFIILSMILHTCIDIMCIYIYISSGKERERERGREREVGDECSFA